MDWIRDRSLTLAMLAFFLIFLAGQIVTGWYEYNHSQAAHGDPPVSLHRYFSTGHMWEATFENWESEFLQMTAFVVLTTVLVQRGSPESRRPGVIEAVDADPRRFQSAPNVPWPVRRGGLVLLLYEHSLGLTFVVLFLGSWVGHALGGYAEYGHDERAHGRDAGPLSAYVTSSRFWFESFQNWQSEFLAIAAMVWLSVYLRQRGSPESKPVHTAHDEND
jgi:hypothetical protein